MCGDKACVGCAPAKCWCGRVGCSCGKWILVIVALVIGLLIGGSFGRMHPKRWMGDRDDRVGMKGDHSMHNMMNDMSSTLNGLSGDELDKQFLKDMIVHHAGAIDMAEKLVNGTNRPELKKLGADIISAQSTEIEMMKGWLKSWYGEK